MAVRLRTALRGWAGTLSSLILLASLVGGVAAPPAPVLRFQLAWLDTYPIQTPRPFDPAHSVRIVDIDEESLRRVGQWPWPRTILAELVDRLSALGAAAIVFDIVFDQPDRTSPPEIARMLAPRPDQAALRNAITALPDHDKIFAASIARARNVSLGFSFIDDPSDVEPTRKGRIDIDPNAGLQKFEGVVRNLPALEAAAAGNGHFTLVPDVDGLARRIPLLGKVGTPRGPQIYPSIDVEAVRIAAGEERVAPLALDGEIFALKIGARRIPIETTRDGASTWFRLWYSGQTQRSRYVPAHRVLENGVDSATIKGRIILIGTSAKGLLDLRATPLNPAAIGVENHAEAVEQMQAGQFVIRPVWSIPVECGFLALAGLAVIVMARWRGAVGAAIVGVVAVALAFGAAEFAFSRERLLLDAATPSVGLALVFAVAAMVAFARSDGERRQVREAFGRYLAPALVERLAAQPDQLRLGGELREMTVLFTDIRGFTAISEQLDPTELTSLLNGFLTPMTATILGCGGTIDKYIGDAIMAFWNAPLAEPAHAELACRAALTMLRELDRLNEARPEGPRLALGIGINTGACCVGNLGSEQRFAYSAIGDTVNLAARFEGQTKQYGVPILIGEATRAALDGFAVLEVDRVQVIGKQQATTIYALLGDEQAATGDFAALARAHAAMLDLYRARRWDKAAELARTLPRVLPEMASVYAQYEERVRLFAIDPPPPGWDGAVLAEFK